MIRLPAPCVVVLVGPAGSGKSTWAGQQFRPGHIVSSDSLRALVGDSEHDQRAGADAFAVLDDVLARRLKRKLVTVIDTLGLDPDRRRQYRDLAQRHGLPCYAVGFDVPPPLCRERNRARERPVPDKVLTSQLRSWAAARDQLPDEGFDAVFAPDAVRLVPAAHLSASADADRQRDDPMALDFGLHISSFTGPGGAVGMAAHLAATAAAAEEAGFGSIWVMDHMLQIPQVGRVWDDLPEGWSMAAYLAGVTQRARLGVLVTAVAFRNLAHLAKIVATVDVLSGGRAWCGLGAGWFEREYRAYGWRFPPVAERYALLEDALELLPLMWGAGTPRFEGRTITVEEAICYPRPIQERIPILVGGSGETRTLRLVAERADACNLFGSPEVVAHKVSVLRRHCEAVGREPDEVAVTHLSTALAAANDAELADVAGRLRPASVSVESFAAVVNAATVDDHVGRFRALAEAGVSTAMVSLADLADGPAAIERFAPVVAAFTA